jgi:HrpA-like RNA helicase
MSTFLEAENDPKSPKNIRQIKVEALSSLDAESQSQQQPSSLYPSLKSEEPSRNNPSDEISPENLPEIAKDYSSVNGNEQGTVKDVFRAEDLEDAEPTEQILLLEQDLEAPSPYREPVDETLPLPETAENKAALVPPVRKKRKKLPQKKDPEQIGQVPEEDIFSPDGSPSVGKSALKVMHFWSLSDSD